jgi:glycosidase
MRRLFSREFHVSRTARKLFELSELLFATDGRIILADIQASRLLAHKINQSRDLIRHPERAIKAGQIVALGLLDEIYHHIVMAYMAEKVPGAFGKALDYLHKAIGTDEIGRTLIRFIDEFPPSAVFAGDLTPEQYLNGSTAGTPNRELVMEELVMLWLTAENPACGVMIELFDDSGLRKSTAYLKIMDALRAFFETQPHFGPENLPLIDLLRSPARASPGSLAGQLEYIQKKWHRFADRFMLRILGGMDMSREEEKIAFAGPGPAQVPTFAGQEQEIERYSPDLHWMPHLVIIAKNISVWLNQLSEKYQRHLFRLDHIPDEELDALAARGFTGLWVIGVWERSRASQQIKQLCGNPEAAASAYSLYDYQIAGDLGGDAALENLKSRALRRGIRLACDMVPNHMGIDSNWVINHPDRFLSVNKSPFPSYRFTGPNLSQDDRVEIRIEDHYFDRSDAAVVFQRKDRWSGREQYIYHGNDGTMMPWNDTAQLDYLNPEVREAVIRMILHVARRFPIIRFDAAMTLAKRHYQRLWFPEPGTGGAIASRAEHSMSKQQFNARIPVEFWREAVDRINTEIPETLLLAEAFWFMEGYFVRSLGMHRVYNSAFMNMLRDEENAKYRTVMKNTLEFDPEILKRFVNFMNNPDERTAVEQFGKGDKYFGICMLMTTLPGLPMFGHGQIEGFSEKYGMEYRRAYWSEDPDEELIRRHEREIFPLLHKRDLFAEVKNFLLYDFFLPEGKVDENVIAYSNRQASEKTLVVYNNRYDSTSGWIRTSVSFSMKTGSDETSRKLFSRHLRDGLELTENPGLFCVFRDHATHMEYMRPARELCNQGLYLNLRGYQYHVFMDWREIQDESGQLAELHAHLNGRGVPDIHQALRDMILMPVTLSFRELIHPEFVGWIVSINQETRKKLFPEAMLQFSTKIIRFLAETAKHVRSEFHPEDLAGELAGEFAALLSIVQKIADPALIIAWIALHRLGRVKISSADATVTRNLLDEHHIGSAVSKCFQEFGRDLTTISRISIQLKILISHDHLLAEIGMKSKQASAVLRSFFEDPDVMDFLQVHHYKDVTYFNKESFEEIIDYLVTIQTIQEFSDQKVPEANRASLAKTIMELADHLKQQAVKSEFQVIKLLNLY